jgi:hypothetical protein
VTRRQSTFCSTAQCIAGIARLYLREEHRWPRLIRTVGSLLGPVRRARGHWGGPTRDAAGPLPLPTRPSSVAVRGARKSIRVGYEPAGMAQKPSAVDEVPPAALYVSAPMRRNSRFIAFTWARYVATSWSPQRSPAIRRKPPRSGSARDSVRFSWSRYLASASSRRPAEGLRRASK